MKHNDTPLIAMGLPAAFFIGSGTYLGYRRMMNSDEAKAILLQRSQNSLPLRPTHHAIKALAYGTALAVSGFGLGIFTVCAVLKVRSVEEFSNEMQTKLPILLKKIGLQVPDEHLREQEKLKDLSFDEELQYWKQKDEEESQTKYIKFRK